MKRGKLSPTQLAYLAGIVDGEGSIFIQHYDKSRSNGSVWTRLVLSVQMKNEFVPRLFQFQFGGCVNKNPKRDGMFRWFARARVAWNVLKALLPYLTIKRPQAELGIRMQERISKHLYNGRGLRVPAEELALREAERILMHKLKEDSYR